MATEPVGYWWLLYRPLNEPRQQFLLEFGREAEHCEWDENERCWWIGPITTKELADQRKRRAHQLALTAALPAGRPAEAETAGVDR
jgi:hypothetical protein